MIKWCSSFWKQRKARLPDSIRILSVRRNAATFQKERMALGQMAFRRERRSLRLPGPRAQPSAAALLTPKNPFCHFIILNLKWYKGVDITVEAIGLSEVIHQTVMLTQRFGEVILLGTPRARAAFDAAPMLL